MFVKTVKVKKLGKWLGYLLLILLAVFVAVFLFNRFYGSNAITLSNEAQQLEFLKSLGWETSTDPIDVRSIVIPEEWNDIYEQYNSLQLAQGLDLNDYRGMDAEIYTYEIYNYGDGQDNVVANLIICGDKLVAGDVCCTELGGFMQGLVKEGSAGA